MKRGMPFFDRFWWLRSFWVAALAVALLWLFWLGIEDLQQPGGLDGGTVPLYLALCTGIGGLLGWAWGQMIKARRRVRARTAAIAGDQDAVPLARYAVEASAAPDLTAAALVVAYPPSRWRTPRWIRLRIITGILGIPCVVGIFVLTLSPWHPVLNAGIAALFGLVTVVGVPSLSELRGLFVLAYRSGRRLTASLEGIEWAPVLGRTRAMRWDEARLLEVSRYADGTTRTGSRVERRRYTLYGATTTLWWNDLGAVYDKPSGDGARLLALVRARTGLVPRTFDQELREATRRVRPGVRLPRARVPALALQLPAGETARAAAEPERVYSLVTYATTNRARAITGGIGALLCLGGVAVVVWVLSLLQVVRAPTLAGGSIAFLNVVWAVLLGVGGLLGCLLVVAAVRKRGLVTIRADARGLSMAGPESSVRLPWNEVASIVYMSARNRHTYVVRAWGATASVAWPAQVSPSVRVEAEPGTVAVTPDELAAVVAARSGKPVEARRLW